MTTFTLTTADYIKAHMLHADRRDAILNELLHNHRQARPNETFAGMIQRGIERALASQAHGRSIDNRVY